MGTANRTKSSAAASATGNAKRETALLELDPRDWIAGLEKGLLLLTAFSDTHPRLTTSTAAMRTGMTRAAARRHLRTLHHLGFADSDGKYFWLTPKVLRLGWSYFESARLPRVAQPFLQRLSNTLGETTNLSLLDEGDVVIVARSVTNRVQSVGFVQGARVSAHLTSAGIAMMACKPQKEVDRWLKSRVLMPYTPFSATSLKDVRGSLAHAKTNGYAYSDQQLVPGVRGVAVALRDKNLELLGALSVSVPVGDEKPERMIARVLPALQEAAGALLAVL